MKLDSYLKLLARAIVIGMLLTLYSYALNITAYSFEYWKFMIVGSVLLTLVLNMRISR